MLGLGLLLAISTGCTILHPITPQQVLAAQETWGRGVIAIGAAYLAGDDYARTAADHVDNLYAFEQGDVLFKPTKASTAQFRLTRDSALSYFVGGDQAYPEDKGFALHPWINVRFENAGMFIHGNYALAMGNYYFQQRDGTEIKVEYTFGYLQQADGTLRINLHHSSLPYEPH
ncbi:MAG: hypothetical protein IPM18_14390 [Phycisphaerales bacterium]|nr:hypothetical protein [Phycisphaerales bacterium]